MIVPAAHHDLRERAVSGPGRGMLLLGAVLALLGLVFFVILILGDDPGRAWRSYHINFLFFTGLSLGGIIFAAIQKVSKGVWAGAIVRFSEAPVAFLPISLVLFLLLFLGRQYLFPWIEHPTPIRGNWLTTGAVFWRDLVAVFAVFGVATAFVYYDLQPDVADLRRGVTGWRRTLYDRIAGDYVPDPEHLERTARRLTVLSPAMLVVYAYGMTLIGFDLLMSLAPYWVSTLLGAFFFMGAFLTGLTTLGLMMVYWRRKLGLQDTIGRQQFHDLGKLIFGFSVFWAYLMFSQLLVIWYGNLREETGFVFYRLWGEWRPIAVLVFLMVFLIPFWGLIWVKAKITPFTFALFSFISLCGVWLERFLLVQPSLTEVGPAFGLPEIGITVGFLGLFLLAYGWFAATFPIVSPRLAAQAEETHH
ncbi:MAG: polysulfide reductase NrfD [Gemmatimonadetes bacterium]|nr:polysulfide reductase NrfD [Gemmatimonadota bacterium]